ncbi:AraC family transcriptional regulator [Parabacteroides merdae]|uniref:helix-turn-helix transcriptional regulator n=1 Tax=Bacteroidales TaxID=171549 RepID=UPI0039B5E500
MRYIEHTFQGIENDLENWQKLLGGTIDGNTLFTAEGTIKEYKFDFHQIIVMRLFLTENVISKRIVGKPQRYYPIIFSDTLTFEPKEERTLQATYTKSLSTGIYFSNEDVNIQYPKGLELKLVLLRVPYEAFENVLSDDCFFLQHLKTGDPYFFYESINMEMKILLQHLFNNNSDKKLNFELARARSWELFVLFADKFFYQRKSHFKQIDRQVLQKLQQVKDFILNDLSSPKNIKELTLFSGMSATKLRASFKEVYGMSIYNFFQEHRMEKAKELLAEGDKSVSEIAYMLGYTHLGHFTGAFKQRYQCLPKDYKP